MGGRTSDVWRVGLTLPSGKDAICWSVPTIQRPSKVCITCGLQLKILYRSGAWIRVRAEFEYGYDNGDTVWGGRVAEEMIVRVDPEKREWSDPQPLHGEYRSLIQLQGDLEEAHEPPVVSSRSTSKEVELSRMNLVCDAV